MLGPFLRIFVISPSYTQTKETRRKLTAGVDFSSGGIHMKTHTQPSIASDKPKKRPRIDLRSARQSVLLFFDGIRFLSLLLREQNGIGDGAHDELHSE